MSVWYHRPPTQQAHQIQNAMLATSSVTEAERGIRLGSRTGGSLRGSHSSRNLDLACTLSRMANTIVTPPTQKRVTGQKEVQNNPIVAIKLWPECTARETAIPIQTSIHGTM